MRFARATGLLPPSSAFPRATTEDTARLIPKQAPLFRCFRELTGIYPSHTSPSSATTSSAVASSSFIESRCIDQRFGSRTRAYSSGTKQTSAKQLQARSVLPQSPPPMFCVSYHLFCLLTPVSWPTRILRILVACTATTRHSSRSAQGGALTCGLMAIMLAHQNCASCRSGAPKTANRSSLEHSLGKQSNW